jgi:hypothetical protein
MPKRSQRAWYCPECGDFYDPENVPSERINDGSVVRPPIRPGLHVVVEAVRTCSYCRARAALASDSSCSSCEDPSSDTGVRYDDSVVEAACDYAARCTDAVSEPDSPAESEPSFDFANAMTLEEELRRACTQENAAVIESESLFPTALQMPRKVDEPKTDNVTRNDVVMVGRNPAAMVLLWFKEAQRPWPKGFKRQLSWSRRRNINGAIMNAYDEMFYPQKSA